MCVLSCLLLCLRSLTVGPVCLAVLLSLGAQAAAGAASAAEVYRERLELDLKVAQAAFDAAPEREDSYIWLGRRYGYLGRNPEAIKVFTAGLEKFPDSYKLLRFRARHLARNRQYRAAIADYRAGLEKMNGHADTFEPNGIANSLELTTSSYRQNLHYYLGQTSFAIADYATMLDELEKSREPLVALPFEDHEIAVTFWQTIALRKQGRHAQAQALLARLQEPVRILENHSYYRALEALAGRVSASKVSATDLLSRFALAMRAEFEGRPEAARAQLASIVADSRTGYWPAEVALEQLAPAGS